MRMRSIWILGIIVLVFVRFICCHNEKFESAETPLQVDLTLIQSAAATGAVCLDGTLPGYHLHRGFGSGANSWLIQLEGGGWCNDINTCVYRKKTRRGSSNYMEKVLQFTGILSNKPEENPDFYNWNRVKLRYCDGASFSGEGSNEAASLQFRGQRIWVAAMEYLMSNGMKDATQALLSGCSAGGLASILHCDEFHDLFQGNTKVKCLADAGMFLDAVNVAGGRTLRTLYNGVVTLQGVSKNLPQYCTSKMDATLGLFGSDFFSVSFLAPDPKSEPNSLGVPFSAIFTFRTGRKSGIAPFSHCLSRPQSARSCVFALFPSAQFLPNKPLRFHNE